jgi:hypothetical protein
MRHPAKFLLSAASDPPEQGLGLVGTCPNMLKYSDTTLVAFLIHQQLANM